MSAPPASLLQFLHRQLARHSADASADAGLLDRFVCSGDEDAFAVLVRRHGPMVFRVCRRVLGDPHAAEDAFQAVFLVLARKARSLRAPESLAAWLHGVAYRIACKARVAESRRQGHQPKGDHTIPDPHADPLAELSARELFDAVDEEIQRLPLTYRLPVILCCLEGNSQEEAARKLGWTPGSVKGRLERGRARLHGRLVRRGLTLSAVLATVEVSQAGAMTAPAVLTAEIVRSAVAFAAGKALASTAVSARALVLAKGGLKTMAIAKAKLGLVLLLTAGMAAAGAGVLAHHLIEGEDTSKAQAQEPPQAAAAAQEQAQKPTPTDRYGDPLPTGVLARLGTIRWRHEGQISGLVFSPDDKTLAGSGLDIILWDVATGRERRRLPVSAQRQWGSGLYFSADGMTLTVAGTNDEISVWDLASGACLRTFALPKLRLPVMSICFSPNGKILAEAEAVRDSVALVDVATGKELKRVGGHRATVYGLAFSPDNSLLALGTLGPSVQLWDVTSGKLVRGIDHHQRQFVKAVAFSPDGKTIASGSGNLIILSDVASGKELGRLEMKMYPAASLAFTPDGKTLLSMGEGRGEIHVWDVKTRKLRSTWPGRFGSGHLALSHNGKIVALGTECSTISLWDTDAGMELFTEFEGHDTAVNCLAFTPDGKALASTGNKQQLRIWDAKTWLPVRELKESSRSLSFAPDGKRLALVPAYQQVVRIKDLVDAKNDLQMPVSDTAYAWRATFVEAGKRLVTVESNRTQGTAGLLTWDAVSGRQLGKLLLPGVIPASFAVTQDGRTAFVGDNEGALHYCSLHARREVAVMSGHKREVGALALSPEEWLLISGSRDHGVRLWERVSGKEIWALQGHKRAVTAVAFSPSGRLAASADGVRSSNPYPVDDPCKIRLWDVVAGKELAHFQGHDSDVASMVFSVDGKALACGLVNSTILIWEVPPEHQIRKVPAERATERDLQARWRDLAANAASEARHALWALVASPEQTVSFLQTQLKPIVPAQMKQVDRWISDLESDRFEERERATQELLRLGVLAEPALKAVLEKRPGLELRRRIERLLEKVHGPVKSPEAIQSLRAVEVLERIGTPEAQNVLQTITKGAPEASLTNEAKASVDRLAKRSGALH